MDRLAHLNEILNRYEAQVAGLEVAQSTAESADKVRLQQRIDDLRREMEPYRVEKAQLEAGGVAVDPVSQSQIFPDVITILMLSANPKDTSPLRLDQERRDVEEGLRRASQRDRFRLVTQVAVRPEDVRRAMLDYDPTIVHFSGHGAGEPGLVLEDVSGQGALVSGEALAGLFELFADRLQCVVLNACYAEVQARAIAEVIPYVVGMNTAIEDEAAIAFAVAFYDGLGAGRGLEFAFKLGRSAIAMAGSSQAQVPVLLKKPQG